MQVECNCKNIFYMRPSDWKRGRRSCSKKCSVKIKNILLNEKHFNWKGENAGYSALHFWVKRRVIKPLNCQDCKKAKPLDLANISNEYKRDLEDWEWLCRKCHMTKDGRLKEFEKLSFNNMSVEKRKEVALKAEIGRKIYIDKLKLGQQSLWSCSRIIPNKLHL